MFCSVMEKTFLHDSTLSLPIRFIRRRKPQVWVVYFSIKILGPLLRCLQNSIFVLWCLPSLCKQSSTVQYRSFFACFEETVYCGHHLVLVSLPPDSRSCLWCLSQTLLTGCVLYCCLKSVWLMYVMRQCFSDLVICTVVVNSVGVLQYSFTDMSNNKNYDFNYFRHTWCA